MNAQPCDEAFAAVITALTFAAARHRDQRRKGSARAPYVNHLIDILDLLWNTGGVRDATVLTAAVLHDSVEDTATRPEEIEAGFGRAVRDLVMEVTDDKSLPKEVRKQLQVEHAPHLSANARLIKLADKISNVRDVADDPPPDWGAARRREYALWALRVASGMRGTHAGLEARLDYEAARVLKAYPQGD